MTNAEWEVQIQGNLIDLDHLTCYFTMPPLVVAKDDHGGYLLRSDFFAACTTSEEVLAVADQQLSILSGVLKFSRLSEPSLCSGGVLRRHPDGRRELFMHIREAVHLRFEALAPTFTITDSNGVVLQKSSPPPTVTIANLALVDSNVGKALRLLAVDGESWVGLYRLLEVIEQNVGGARNLVKCGWCSKSQLNRFKHTANSVKAVGDAARHGKELEAPPKDPMSLGDAKSFVNHLMQAWFDSKGA